MEACTKQPQVYFQIRSITLVPTIPINESKSLNPKFRDYCRYFILSCAILVPTHKERAFCSALFEIKSRLGKKEVMPMIESSIPMGHQVVASRLCAGAVL